MIFKKSLVSLLPLHPHKSGWFSACRVDVEFLLVNFKSWKQSKTDWHALPRSSLNVATLNLYSQILETSPCLSWRHIALIVMPSISFIFRILIPSCKSSFAFIFHFLEMWKLQHSLSKICSHIFLMEFCWEFPEARVKPLDKPPVFQISAWPSRCETTVSSFQWGTLSFFKKWENVGIFLTCIGIPSISNPHLRILARFCPKKLAIF